MQLAYIMGFAINGSSSYFQPPPSVPTGSYLVDSGVIAFLSNGGGYPYWFLENDGTIKVGLGKYYTAGAYYDRGEERVCYPASLVDIVANGVPASVPPNTPYVPSNDVKEHISPYLRNFLVTGVSTAMGLAFTPVSPVGTVIGAASGAYIGSAAVDYAEFLLDKFMTPPNPTTPQAPYGNTTIYNYYSFQPNDSYKIRMNPFYITTKSNDGTMVIGTPETLESAGFMDQLKDKTIAKLVDVLSSGGHTPSQTFLDKMSDFFNNTVGKALDNLGNIVEPEETSTSDVNLDKYFIYNGSNLSKYTFDLKSSLNDTITQLENINNKLKVDNDSISKLLKDKKMSVELVSMFDGAKVLQEDYEIL